MEKDKRNCPEEDKGKMRGHSIFPKIIFGEEKCAKNLYFMPKTFLKTPKIKIFSPKIFFGKGFSIFGGIFGESQGGHFYEIKKFQK